MGNCCPDFCCCPQKEEQEPLLAKNQGGLHESDGFKGEEMNSSYDEETDAEIETNIIDQARIFFKQHDNAIVSICEEQFKKLLKRRRYRRMITYLGVRDVEEYRDNVKRRLKKMLFQIEPTPPEENQDKVLIAVLKLSLQLEMRRLIMNSVANQMECE